MVEYFGSECKLFLSRRLLTQTAVAFLLIAEKKVSVNLAILEAVVLSHVVLDNLLSISDAAFHLRATAELT